MRKLILFIFLSFLAFNFASAQKRQIEVAKKPVVSTDSEAKKYIMVFFSINDKTDHSKEESAEIDALHKEFLNRLNEEGYILMQGTIEDEGSWKEILLVKSTELEEARARFQEDPAVKRGKYNIEFHQFLTKNNSITLE